MIKSVIADDQMSAAMHGRHFGRSGLSRYRIGVLVLAGTLGALLATQTGEAHKKVTSRYNYNDHVFPIFRARCSQCHVKNGVAPMSLVTYQDAIPWAESLRLELLAAGLPAEQRKVREDGPRAAVVPRVRRRHGVGDRRNPPRQSGSTAAHRDTPQRVGARCAGRRYPTAVRVERRRQRHRTNG